MARHNFRIMDRVTQLRRLGLFDARVPRYTSYPTANQFTSGVGAEEVNDWLVSIPPDTSISMYLHVPFCRRLCWFCACRTQGTATGEPVAAYVETLKSEIALVADKLPQGVSIGRVHWGGGTPTLLSPDLIRELSIALATAIPFAKDAEFSVEIDPNEIDDERLDALADCGMSRASIGVQDFDPEIQKVIGRPQSFEVTKRVIDGLRRRGIESLNIDILYGLPHQTEIGIGESVQKVLSLGADRVALYGYAHVPWMARRQAMIPAEALPPPEARLDLFETARNLFVWDGYEEIGIDHFARPEDGLAEAAREGRLKRNFQGYTDDQFDTLVAMGASAISKYPAGYAQNAPGTAKYQNAIRNGKLATERGHVMTQADRLRSVVIEDLMCRFEVDFASVSARCGCSASDVSDLFNGIDEHFSDILVWSQGRIGIRPEARQLTRMIARFVDAYASPQQSHSLAI